MILPGYSEYAAANCNIQRGQASINHSAFIGILVFSYKAHAKNNSITIPRQKFNKCTTACPDPAVSTPNNLTVLSVKENENKQSDSLANV